MAETDRLPPLSIRVNLQQKWQWRAKAESEGLSLNAWISKVCDEATKGEDVTRPGPCAHHYAVERLVCLDCGQPI